MSAIAATGEARSRRQSIRHGRDRKKPQPLIRLAAFFFQSLQRLYVVSIPKKTATPSEKGLRDLKSNMRIEKLKLLLFPSRSRENPRRGYRLPTLDLDC
jgi:hypothetical protein